MPRRRQAFEQAQSPADDENWWLSFLKSKGLISVASPPPLSITEHKSSSDEISPDMRTFIERVAERLTPISRYASIDEIKRIQQIREDVKRQLANVLGGKMDLREWFTKTRQTFNLRSYELARILYESLDGLHSAEARQLRDQWFQYMVAEMKGYGLA
ncbi:MAG: hypothetical protein QXK90_01165 [Candidatus Parvarchaeota archaeon]